MNQDLETVRSNEENHKIKELKNSAELGEIKINHSVIASIVRLATLEVSGVCSVGGGIVDGLAEIFSKKENERGVKVSEDDQGNYVIEIRVILKYGSALTNVALQIQQHVKEQVIKMTLKSVAHIDVIIDGVKIVAEEENPANL